MKDEHWGNNLRHAREFRRFTQRELAKKVGIPWETISLVETGKRETIRIPKLARLAVVLSISSDELIGVTPGRWEKDSDEN